MATLTSALTSPADAALPDPLLVNFKSVRFIFVPDAERGRVNVIAEPKLPQVELTHSIKLNGGGCGNFRAGIKADIQNTPRAARVTLTGTMPAACGERSWYLGLLSPAEYAYGLFKTLWEESGGVLRGRWRDGVPGGDARLLTSAESPALAEVIRDINKFSNNVMARHLYLTLSSELMKAPGTGDRSGRTIAQWLGEKGLDMPELVMENGSGLSRIERISAGSLGRLLVTAFGSSVMPEFMSSMPLVAVDGSMRRRLRFGSVAGQAHIKTGGLNDVSTIAGYTLDQRGRRYAVAFFVNHANAHATNAAQDEFLKWVQQGAGR